MNRNLSLGDDMLFAPYSLRQKSVEGDFIMRV